MTYISELGTYPDQNLNTALDKKQVLGKEDFLKLLVAQLQNQNPLNPSDPTEFTAQLAQFSSLEQLFAINTNLAQLSTSNAELEKLSALSLIGKEIVSEGNDFRLGNDPIELGYRLDSGATEATIHIQDEHGRTVASLDAADLTPGEHYITWDGTSRDGQIVPPGRYSLFISAMGPDDEVIKAAPLIKGLVFGVDLDEQGNILVTSTGNFRLDTVKSIRSY